MRYLACRDVVFLIPLSALSVEHPGEVLAKVRMMVPKANKVEQLEKAIQKHNAHRAKSEDPKRWLMYSAELGGGLDIIIACSQGFG